jgi:hypothetical protein
MSWYETISLSMGFTQLFYGAILGIMRLFLVYCVKGHCTKTKGRGGGAVVSPGGYDGSGGRSKVDQESLQRLVAVEKDNRELKNMLAESAKLVQELRSDVDNLQQQIISTKQDVLV